MPIDIRAWMGVYTRTVKDLFGNRVRFVGLQGSYGRGEATETSDIDVVLVLDRATVQDLAAYDAALSALPHRDKVCGFVSGARELRHWIPSDLFQFCHDTTPVFGDLRDLVPEIAKEDVRRAILSGACNLYHACGHNVVHEKDPAALTALYKTAFFLLQALLCDRTGVYVKTRDELASSLAPREQQILLARDALKARSRISRAEFEAYSERLFAWTGDLICEYGARAFDIPARIG